MTHGDSSPFNFKTWSVTLEDPATGSGTQTQSSNLKYSIQTLKVAKDISNGIEGDINNAPDKFRWYITEDDSVVPGDCHYYQ